MIAISAKKLQKNSPRIIALNKELTSTLKNINNEIKNVSNTNITYIKYSFMPYFDIPGMNNKDAQSIIYGKAIEELEKNGFDITVIGSRDKVKLLISWDIHYNKSEIDRYKNLLLSRHEGYRKKQLFKLSQKK